MRLVFDSPEDDLAQPVFLAVIEELRRAGTYLTFEPPEAGDKELGERCLRLADELRDVFGDYWASLGGGA